jgi:hypothetical protein
MRSVLIVGALVALLAGGAWPVDAAAQAAQSSASVDPALRTRVERRFRVLPVSGGVVLTPRRDVQGVESIEIRDGLIALNGTPATGAQLRERLGADADLVLQVSYLTPEALREWAGPRTPAAESLPEVAPIAPRAPRETADAEREAAERERERAQEEAERERERERQADDRRVRPSDTDRAPGGGPWRKSSAKVHIGSSVTVAEDEYVTDPVVAVGGSVTVLGRVDDDVVAVGGSVRLGPHARVRGDVTAVGGRIDQQPGAFIGGAVNEVRIGGGNFQLDPWFFAAPWLGLEMFGGWFKLAGTLLRISLVLLLAFLVLIIAKPPVERIAERAGRDPWLSGFTGLLAQLLFVPVLVITVVVLSISIIGIPLLVLVPFAVIAFLIAILIGFTGVALRVGRWAVGPDRPPFVALAVGVVLIAAIALLARGLSLLPVPLWPITWFVAVVGFLAEYVAWTVGLGAALLTRFGTRGPLEPYDAPVTPPPLPPIVSGPTEA